MGPVSCVTGDGLVSPVTHILYRYDVCTHGVESRQTKICKQVVTITE
jgi:hypothetical protein